MSEQMNINSVVDGKADSSKYNDWIMNIGDLREKTLCWEDDTLVKLNFRGKTSLGELIDVTMHLESVGNGSVFVGSESKNIIYLNGVDY